MSSRLINSLLATACLIVVSIPLSAQKGKPGGGGGGGGSTSTGCAVVATPATSSVTISPGMNIGVFGRVSNCSTGKKRYMVTLTSMSSCNAETVIASSLISFAGGESKLYSISYPIAPDTCAGDMTISVKVYDGSTMLATDSTSVVVQ
ncbi:MAG TPA: hypothetical protein VLB68_16255 [Pyrinomonadaceae bacterium]|nr:hypothetical protein [Pyrinomonadaceae bacterium]